MFLTNFLLEAIRHSFFPAVQYILNNYHESGLAPAALPSLSLDPLSLSLLTYASLAKEDPSKKEAWQIIRTVADHTDVEKNYHFFIEFPPMAWASLLGLLEEVKFLHENKKAQLIIDIHDGNGNWKFDILDYTRSQGFLLLSEYLNSKRGPSKCQENFLQ